MTTRPMEKQLKIPSIPPGTKRGPMGLPISYSCKDYVLPKKPTRRVSPKRQG